MNNRPNNPARGNGNDEPENNKHQMKPDKLIEFAREYFAADFPNPDRRDCPDRATLDSLARSGRLPDDDLRAHLFGCSDCFNEYRTALAERPQPSPVVSQKASWQDRLSTAWTPLVPAFRPGLARAGAAALVLIAFAVWTAWRAVPDAPSQTIAQHNSQAGASLLAPALSDPAPTPQIARTVSPPVPQQRLGAKRRSVTPAVEATVSIDLNEYVAMRGVADATRLGQKVITLAPVRTRLKLRLPEGSLAGRYTISLVDEFEHPITAKTVTSQDGRWLKTALNLRRAIGKSQWLGVKHRDELAEVYPLTLQR